MAKPQSLPHARVARRRAVRPGRVMMLGFLAMMLAGAVLLHLPISARGGIWTDPMVCLFTAASATCITGMTVVDTCQHWSPFGQGVILCLLQIGGLGIMSAAAMVAFLTRRTITVRERLEMSASFSVGDIAGIVRLTQGVIRFTLAAEGIGAALLALRFVPQFGFWKGIGKSIFHAVAAFCNSGFDLMGEQQEFSSLTGYADDPLVTGVTMALIVMGGLGFLVWHDLVRHRKWEKFSVHTKLVLVMTGILLAAGTVLFFLLESGNPRTLGGLPLGQRVLAALFQSVTCRTAGFVTIDQTALTNASVLVSLLLMFIGGSPGSTGGGIKTTAAALLALAALSVLRGKRDITVFRRRIDNRAVLHALTVCLVAAMLIFVGTLLLCVSDGVSIELALYETVSAFSTTGSTQNLTPTLGTASRLWLIVEMYLGRVGIMTLGVAVFLRRVSEQKIRYPEGRVMIG